MQSFKSAHLNPSLTDSSVPFLFQKKIKLTYMNMVFFFSNLIFCKFNNIRFVLFPKIHFDNKEPYPNMNISLYNHPNYS